MNEDLFASRTKTNVGQAQAASGTMHLNHPLQGQAKKHKVGSNPTSGLLSKGKKDSPETDRAQSPAVKSGSRKKKGKNKSKQAQAQTDIDKRPEEPDTNASKQEIDQLSTLPTQMEVALTDTTTAKEEKDQQEGKKDEPLEYNDELKTTTKKTPSGEAQKEDGAKQKIHSQRKKRKGKLNTLNMTQTASQAEDLITIEKVQKKVGGSKDSSEHRKDWSQR